MVPGGVSHSHGALWLHDGRSARRARGSTALETPGCAEPADVHANHPVTLPRLRTPRQSPDPRSRGKEERGVKPRPSSGWNPVPTVRRHWANTAASGRRDGTPGPVGAATGVCHCGGVLGPHLPSPSPLSGGFHAATSRVNSYFLVLRHQFPP